MISYFFVQIHQKYASIAEQKYCFSKLKMDRRAACVQCHLHILPKMTTKFLKTSSTNSQHVPGPNWTEKKHFNPECWTLNSMNCLFGLSPTKKLTSKLSASFFRNSKIFWKCQFLSFENALPKSFWILNRKWRRSVKHFCFNWSRRECFRCLN